MGEPAEDAGAAAPSPTSETAGQICQPEPCPNPEDVEQPPAEEETPPAAEENCAAACTALANDSGVEVAGGEYASSGAPDQMSCASSLISCGSVCDDSFDMLSCKHDRLDDFKAGAGTAGDGTSEGGSESSSVTGGGNSGPPRRNTNNTSKRRVAVNDTRPSTRPRPVPAPRGPNLATRERARSRDKANSAEKPPPPGPKPNIVPRSRLRNAPDVLALICRESPSLKVKATKTSAARCRTPGTPPDEPRSLRLVTPLTPVTPPLSRARTAAETKAAFDKYATLPRRKRETSPTDATPMKKDYARSASVSRDALSANRGAATLRRTNAMESPPLRSLPPYPKHKLYPKTRIYHETYAQTALSGSDVQKALEGVGIKEIRTDLVVVQKSTKGIQVDYRNIEVERLEQKIKALQEANVKLQGRYDAQSEKVAVLESRLEAERADKMAAQVELQQNTERVLQLVGGGQGGGERDGLVLLEEQLKSSAGMVARQQDEISRLHDICRELQKEVDNGCRSIRSLESLLRCQESESSELLDFLACEKSALQEALREAELAAREVAPRRAECRALLRLAETRRQQLLEERARRAQHQACACAPTHAALKPALNNLLAAMCSRYRIPPEDLEDVIFHNEAFSRSASSEAYSPLSPPPRAPQPAQAATHARLSDDEISADLLDSETEPCLMMESVLEDVAVPDTYSHNLVSSGLSVMSCPTQLNKSNKLQPLLSKDDSCSSLQNITTNFSADDYSPVVDDKFANDMANYYNQNGIDSVDAFYLENDISLQNLSQAILQRQQSEAECNSLSNVDFVEGVGLCSVGESQEMEGEAGKGGCLVEQVIEVDNLVNKLLKVFRIIQETEDMGQHLKTVKESTLETKPVSDAAATAATAAAVGFSQATDKVKHMEISEEHNAAQEVPHQNGLQYDSPGECVSPSCEGSGEWCRRHCGGSPSPARLPSLPDCNTSTPQPINSAA